MKDCADTMRWAGTGQANSGVRAEFAAKQSHESAEKGLEDARG